MRLIDQRLERCCFAANRKAAVSLVVLLTMIVVVGAGIGAVRQILQTSHRLSETTRMVEQHGWIYEAAVEHAVVHLAVDPKALTDEWTTSLPDRFHDIRQIKILSRFASSTNPPNRLTVTLQETDSSDNITLIGSREFRLPRSIQP